MLLYFQSKNLQFVRNEYRLKVKFYFLFPIKDRSLESFRIHVM